MSKPTDTEKKRKNRAQALQAVKLTGEYAGAYPLTVERVQWFLSRHTLSVQLGNSRGYEPLVWWAHLMDQEGYDIGEKPCGRGTSPDEALLDLFRTLSGETVTVDYDFGRALLTVRIPPFSFGAKEAEARR